MTNSSRSMSRANAPLGASGSDLLTLISPYDSWTMLKYPIPKPKRIALVKLYYEVATTPGMPANIIAVAADALNFLTRSKDKLKIEDLRLPWKPIYTLLSKELFLSRRKFEIKCVAPRNLVIDAHIHLTPIQPIAVLHGPPSRIVTPVFPSCRDRRDAGNNTSAF